MFSLPAEFHFNICEISLNLRWSENCVLTDIKTQTAARPQGDNPARE